MGSNKLFALIAVVALAVSACGGTAAIDSTASADTSTSTTTTTLGAARGTGASDTTTTSEGTTTSSTSTTRGTTSSSSSSSTTTTTTRATSTTTTTTTKATSAPPKVSIATPKQASLHAATYNESAGWFVASVAMEAIVSDPDGNPVTVEWFSDVDGFLGSGKAIIAQMQPRGDSSPAVVTARATDSTGAVASASVQIIIWVPSDQ